jgi:hypothetical protein
VEIVDDPLSCPQQIKDTFTGVPGDPTYDHLAHVKSVLVSQWPSDVCRHYHVQGDGEGYTYQFQFDCDTLQMSSAKYWKHTGEYTWRQFAHDSCIPPGETEPCGGDPCLICREEIDGEMTHKCHPDFSNPACGRATSVDVKYSTWLVSACFPAAAVEIVDDPH